MRKKGTKRRIMVTLVAVLLMATSVTAFAGSATGNNVTANLTRKTFSTVEAMTSLIDQTMEPPMYTYVKMRVYFTSTNGKDGWSEFVSDYAPRYSVAVKTIHGTYIRAESQHGIRPGAIELYMYIN